MTSFQPNVGDVILNKYECISLVGEGAFGCVYRARDIKLGRIVAIKFINAANGVLKRFGDELDAIKNLDHPNIVRLYDYDILKGGIPCLVMEFVNGRELGEILSQEGPFDLPRICDIALQVLDALVETHNHEIIHCDLKPENIMLTSVGARTNVVKLIDFGVAALLEKTTSDNERQKLLIGTPQYMAPEQIRHEQLGPWTDNYALGLILIELFSGQFVFDHENPREILKMQLFQPAILPHELAISELGPIISRAVEKDVSKRYQDTREFYNDVSNAIQAIQIAERSKPINKARLNSVNSVFEDLDDLKSFKPTNLTLQSGLHRLPTQMKMIELDENDLKGPASLVGNDVTSFKSEKKSEPPISSRSANLGNLSVNDERINLKSRREKLSQTILKPASNHISDTDLGRPLIPEIPKRTNSIRLDSAPAIDVPSISKPDVPSIPKIEGLEPLAVPPKLETPEPKEDLNVGLDLSSLQSSLENMGDKSASQPTTNENVPTLRPHVPTLGPVVPKLSNGLKSASKGAPTAKNAEATPALAPAPVPKTKTIHQDNSNSKGKNRTHLIIIVLSLVLLILCGGGYYVWNTGLLEKFGIIESKTQEIPKPQISQNAEAEIDNSGIVRFSTIRNTAQKMAYTAAISGTLGHAQSLKKLTNYRVVGSPTDAAVYINDKRVCGKTPCDVHVFGNIEKVHLEIRKGNKNKSIDLAQQNPADPIILVLGK